ncbi:MAG: methyltransferase domain-containing protein [Candidatus Polarisedimenticolaceae bacterium]|nr:methyltransferase domain-containing protein [Candidatus Polarisedimenticolaceae bacterium]
MPGEILWQQERAAIERLLPSLFGYYALQIGRCADGDASLQGWRIRHRFLLDSQILSDERMAMAVADPLQLPVKTDSVDAVLLPHTLDFSADPHQLLREVERVLIADGRLVVVGFNSWSLWGAWRQLAKRGGAFPWHGHFLSARRLQDWLTLLGFEVESCEMIMFRPPLRSKMLMQRLEFMESMGQRFWPLLGGSYVVKAVKRESLVRPIHARWSPTVQVLGASVMKPTTRSKNG